MLRNSWDSLFARFPPRQYLGLHLAIGLIASALGLWFFAGIIEAVVPRGRIVEFDLTVLHWLHARNTPHGLGFFSTMTWVGSPIFMAGVGVVVALVLARRQQSIVMWGWIAALAGGWVLERVLKLSIRRPRPEYSSEFLYSFSYSFPSGHALGSLIGYGMLAYILVTCWTLPRGARSAIVAGSVLLVAAIGFSRLYLGVHYLSDVIAGYAVGIFWLSICITGVEVARRDQAPDRNR